MTETFSLPANGSFSFKDRTALVTGGGRGVGEAVAREIHAGGGKVAVSDVDPEAARQVALSLDPSGASAMALTLDVRSKADFLAARDAVSQAWGRVDIVVNNAGYAKRTPTQDISPEEFDEIVQINMRSVFLSCQIFSEHMREHGYGRIVNITSLAGQNGGTVASPHYAASKAGAIMLTKYFARYLAGSGVTVNAIAPGPIDTAKGRLSPEQIARVEGEVPIGRFMQVSEIAAATALLASDRGGFFVGATLDMNGGLYLR
ncbi:SDR family NAD(P)-dependent oxidoreductase [Novosphingobium terrae]|uniref:SDR family NAD(P)-dependent oxidoreductase n=1 Tax=Novosphingobium terrae TaxID=2726189 RepID=UPI00197FA2CE|nr:SDR family NAD(P)-dependent oxidoreductase [Novosphingobium terrae]